MTKDDEVMENRKAQIPIMVKQSEVTSCVFTYLCFDVIWL